MTLRLLAVTLTLLILGTLAFTSLSPALQRDTPRDLPWTLPDYRDAKVQWRVLEDGRLYNEVEHLYLENITPAMVAWFYQQLPISTVDLNGTTYPLYHLFHPTEHGRINVVQAAPDGTPGMAQGSMIMREEWFGPFDSKGAARMVEFSDNGMLAIPKVAGLSIGEVRHTYRAENGGTRYTVKATLGSDLPILGTALNWYLRNQVFHPEMMAQWQRHQVEEVSSLQFFLRDLYLQRGESNHFKLNIQAPEAAAAETQAAVTVLVETP